MEKYLNNQLCLFIIYIASGIIISVLFDIFRSLRKSIKTSNFITYIEDTIFWIIVGIFLIWEIIKFNLGELRLYIFIGLILGSLLYFFTISKCFIRITVVVFNFVKKIILSIYNLIINIIKKPICLIIINLRKLKEKVKNIGIDINKKHKSKKTKSIEKIENNKSDDTTKKINSKRRNNRSKKIKK